VLQRISAIIIVLFIFFHVLALKYGLFRDNYAFEPHHALGTVGRHFQMPNHWFIVSVVYPIGILASCYHLANGFWTAAITWGLTISNCAQRRWGFVCAGLFAVTFIAGMIALIASANLNWQEMMQTQQVLGHGT
jgi:succinate dehydrogenase / fumarate reductase cytochrome b subunit